ncbi:zinc finger BED domain-containing protein 4-like [Ylistrum balloti]|uniref:zinc finger BED domain-containing protein 4-like n=1 Tax=Ylistrum balloti TaxID=509963 RepID=UPI002905A8B6|nr:zinc finger BED domain-containing protein 4-like [Ylistrum balloti]XP_060082782.1 zinc finger BED domain-containing protein 4-like [Ylistrum balloti]
MQISSVSRLLGRMRRIVTFFHSSSTATKKLKDKQKALNLPAKRLVQDVKTRWNSSFDMMSTFLEQQPAVYATLTEKDIKKNLKEVVTLSDTDISLAEELVDVLKPLKTITTIMCEEKSPTISLVHLMKERLLRQLRENESDSGLAAQVKTEIRNDIESRYSDPDIIRWLEMCCALDPRFKTLPYHDQVEANRVYGNLVDMMTESEEEFSAYSDV